MKAAADRCSVARRSGRINRAPAIARFCSLAPVIAVALLWLGANRVAFAQDRTLVWSDDFQYAGAPDPAKWSYEYGFVRNHESQFYTRDRLENARVENGMLIIEARKEHWLNPDYDPTSKDPDRRRQFAEYTSASLITRQKASWRFGRIEVDAKIPRGKGVWPAIWMLGDGFPKTPWPRCGETDIMEFVGHDPTHLYATVHWSRNGKPANEGSKIKAMAPYDDFHVYAVDWTPKKMDFYFDDKMYFSFNVDHADQRVAAAEPGDGRLGKTSDDESIDENPFRRAQFLILNLAIGGDWGGAIDDTIFPRRYLIKSARIFSLAPKK